MLEALLIYLVIQFVVYDLDPNPAPKGYTHYDPCIRCGEDWEFYPPSNSNINKDKFTLPQTQTME